MKNGRDEKILLYTKGTKMKCEICGTELRAEPAITEPGWVIFYECIIRGDTEQEVIDNYEKIRVSAHISKENEK